jgi:hypothetical protein
MQSSRKSILFAPYWIRDILERNNLPLNAVLSLNTLSGVLSGEDIACIIDLNERAQMYFGFDTSDICGVHNNWFANSEASVVYAAAQPLTKIIDLNARLFDEALKTEKYPHPYSVVDVGSDTLVVNVFPGHFSKESGRVNQKLLTRDLLKLFYAYEGFDQMAHRNLFPKFVADLF